MTEKVSATMKYHNHTLQTNPQLYEDEHRKLKLPQDTRKTIKVKQPALTSGKGTKCFITKQGPNTTPESNTSNNKQSISNKRTISIRTVSSLTDCEL